MILLIHTRLMKWFDENNIQTVNNSNANPNTTTPRSPTNSKSILLTSQSSKIDDVEQEQSKKCSMKTAEDVISRIEWDDQLDSRYFRVGYVDRFIGLQEKPFTDFDFKVDLSTVSDRHSKVLAIPKHRIQYFKYNNEIVWDKETRTDLMFGSTGNEETIYDVIKRHEHLMENHEIPSPNQNQEETSINNDLDENDPTPSPRYLTLTDGTYKPNYYLSIPMTNPTLIKNYQAYRDKLWSTYPSLFPLKSTSENEDHLHLTILTLRIEGSTLFEQCCAILKRLQEEIHYHCSYPERLSLDFHGIDTFYDRVIFLKCQQNRRLENLRNLIVERLCEQQQKQRITGIYLAGNRAEFIPHLTLLRCKRKFSSFCSNETKADIDFGQQTIDCLALSPILNVDAAEHEKTHSIFRLDLS